MGWGVMWQFLHVGCPTWGCELVLGNLWLRTWSCVVEKQSKFWIEFFFVWWREEDMRFGASRLVRDSRGRVGFGPLVRAVCCFFSVSKSNSPKQREYWCVVGCLWLMSPTCSLEMRLWLQRSLLYLVVNKFLIPFFSE